MKSEANVDCHCGCTCPHQGEAKDIAHRMENRLTEADGVALVGVFNALLDLVPRTLSMLTLHVHYRAGEGWRVRFSSDAGGAANSQPYHRLADALRVKVATIIREITESAKHSIVKEKWRRPVTQEEETIRTVTAYAKELSCPLPAGAARLIAARVPVVTFEDHKALVACVFLIAHDAMRRGEPVTRTRVLAVMDCLFPAVH